MATGIDWRFFRFCSMWEEESVLTLHGPNEDICTWIGHPYFHYVKNIYTPLLQWGEISIYIAWFISSWFRKEIRRITFSKCLFLSIHYRGSLPRKGHIFQYIRMDIHTIHTRALQLDLSDLIKTRFLPYIWHT